MVNLCSGLSFLLPVYHVAGMHGRFGCHVNATCISTVVSSTTLRVVIMLLPTQDQAFVIGSGTISLWILLSGFFVKFSDMGAGFEALQWASPFRYSVGYFVHCELVKDEYEVMAAEGPLPGELEALLKYAVPTTLSGAELIRQFEYDALSAEEELAVLLGIYVALFLALYLAHRLLRWRLIHRGHLSGLELRRASLATAAEVSVGEGAAAPTPLRGCLRREPGGLYRLLVPRVWNPVRFAS